MLIVPLACACGGGPTSPSNSSISAGQWRGTTSEGAVIEFTVSQDDMLTSLTIGRSFEGCTDSQTFSGLQISTVLEESCVSGACRPTNPDYRSLTFTSGGTPGVDPITSVFGLFLPLGGAQGIAVFQNFPGCGDVEDVTWTATRR